MSWIKRTGEFCAVAAALIWIQPIAGAHVKAHGLFTDGAVLQQGMRVPVWGSARDGEKVTVQIGNDTEETTAAEGAWKVYLKPMTAGGPYTMTIQGENRIVLKDILVGEVYVCSGQSNMEMPMAAQVAGGSEAIARSADPMLHLLTVPRNISDMPLRDITAQWQPANPGTVTYFSAVAYFFGRDLRRDLKVPVGLIHTSWGGTPAQAWTSWSALKAEPSLLHYNTDYERARTEYGYQRQEHQAAQSRYQGALAAAKANHTEIPKPPTEPHDPMDAGHPSGLFNGMIAPLIPYAIRGAIWYQGESNSGASYEYQTLFPTMIADWRREWGEGDFPFFFVQLAPYMAITTHPEESGWAELREAQRLTTLRVPHTGMAVITDVGDEKDIHPRRKEPVGDRLERAALALANGRNIEYSGPTYNSIAFRDDKAIVRFKHAAGLHTEDGAAVKGFAIAGEDHKWVNATAVLKGNSAIVSSPQVSRPYAVRYGWANYPVVNLVNRAGLPASPFRTDHDKLTSEPR